MMDKYFKNSFSFKLIHFVLPKINHSRLFLFFQVKSLCLSIIHATKHKMFILYKFKKEAIMTIDTNKLISKIMKIGTSNGVVLGKDASLLLGRKINLNEKIIIKRTKKNTLEIAFCGLEQGLPNE